MNNTLESNPIFPYVAWAVVIGFALFTYTLTLNLNAEVALIAIDIDAIEDRVDTLEQTVIKNADLKKIKDPLETAGTI